MSESYQSVDEEKNDPDTARRLGKDKYASTNTRRREVYRSQQNLKGANNTWHIHTEDFTPQHTKYSPKWGRVMLYAYHGGGQVDFDDVVLKQIAPPPQEQKKEFKKSLDTNVSIKEMEEVERRSQEAKEEIKEKKRDSLK